MFRVIRQLVGPLVVRQIRAIQLSRVRSDRLALSMWTARVTCFAMEVGAPRLEEAVPRDLTPKLGLIFCLPYFSQCELASKRMNDLTEILQTKHILSSNTQAMFAVLFALVLTM